MWKNPEPKAAPKSLRPIEYGDIFKNTDTSFSHGNPTRGK